MAKQNKRFSLAGRLKQLPPRGPTKIEVTGHILRQLRETRIRASSSLIEFPKWHCFNHGGTIAAYAPCAFAISSPSTFSCYTSAKTESNAIRRSNLRKS